MLGPRYDPEAEAHAGALPGGIHGRRQDHHRQLLAERFGWNFADLDDEIEAASMRTIGEIFERDGEAEFRRIEQKRMRTRVQVD